METILIERSEIFRFSEKAFSTKPDYPFEKFPHYAVLRHADNDKWFGLVMNVPRHKLGLRGEDGVDVLDVKCHPGKVDALRNRRGFLPAYHMNKDHWLTVVLDGSVSKRDVFALLKESYDLTR